MAIFRHTKDLPAAARGAVVVIGNFDGVHRGHQLLLADARRQADAPGATLAVLTFEPHPRAVFLPAQPPFSLTSLPAQANRTSVGSGKRVSVRVAHGGSR